MDDTANHIETELQTPKAKTHALSIASMILGILSFVCGFLTSIPGLITGIISLRKIKKSAGLLAGRGFAITGIVISSVNLFIYSLLILSLSISLFSSGLRKVNPEGILKNGRLANLPESATNVNAEGWSALFTGMQYLMFKATSQDIEKFIAASASIKDVEPQVFSTERQYLPNQNDINFATEEEFEEYFKHKYFFQHGNEPEWYNPTIRKSGRIYEIPGDQKKGGHNWGEVIINEETNTIFIWVCWS